MALHVEKYGNPANQNLVLIHGWGMHGGVWQTLIARLEPWFYLHIIDLPGMGFSPPLARRPENLPISADASLNAIAGELATVLPPGATICGWSFGGQIAMQLVLHYPHQVKKLVLIGSTPKFVNADASLLDPHAWLHGMDASIFRQFADNVRQDYQATLLKFLTLQCMRSSDAKATIKQLRESFALRPEPDANSLQQGLDILLHNDLRLLIPTLTQPTLIVHGDRDTLAPISAAQWMARQLSAAQTLLIPGASHAPFLSHPNIVADGIRGFLSPASLPLPSLELNT